MLRKRPEYRNLYVLLSQHLSILLMARVSYFLIQIWPDQGTPYIERFLERGFFHEAPL